MDVWQSLSGLLEVEITSADTAALLHVINLQGIAVFEVRQTGALTIRFQVLRSEYGAVKRICAKRGEKLTVRGRRGGFWYMKRLLRRPVLLGGMILLLCATLYLPSRVLFVGVEGNEKIPGKQILEAAEACGIRFGASRRAVRSERVKNMMLEVLPELQWIGVNTSGCVATVSVRERSELPREAMEGWGNIVASRDAVITSLTATRGSAVCEVGQAVRKGQLLISGYTDSGIHIQLSHAEGEIYGKTHRELTVFAPKTGLHKTQIRGTVKLYSILIGKKRINLWKDSGISDTTCGRMYKEYYMTLPGGFQLPVGLSVDEIECWETAECAVPDRTLAMSSYAQRYLLDQLIAGVILEKEEAFLETEDGSLMTGNYVCTEMIAREQIQQIGDLHGENS